MTPCSAMLCPECHGHYGVCRFHGPDGGGIPRHAANGGTSELSVLVEKLEAGLKKAAEANWWVGSARVKRVVPEIGTPVRPVTALVLRVFLPFSESNLRDAYLSLPQNDYARYRLELTEPVADLGMELCLNIKSFNRIWRYVLFGGDAEPLSLGETQHLLRHISYREGNTAVASVLLSATGFDSQVLRAVFGGDIPLPVFIDTRAHQMYFCHRYPDMHVATLIGRCLASG